MDIKFAIITCSDTRSIEEDTAGARLEELIAEHPDWAAVEFEKIDENVHPEIADRYDYYANPSMFLGDEKLYESHLFETEAECRCHVEEVFRRALAD